MPRGTYKGVSYAEIRQHSQSGNYVFIGRQVLTQVGDPQHVEIERQGSRLVVTPAQGTGRSVSQGRVYINDHESIQLALALGTYSCEVQRGKVVIDLSAGLDFDQNYR